MCILQKQVQWAQTHTKHGTLQALLDESWHGVLHYPPAFLLLLHRTMFSAVYIWFLSDLERDGCARQTLCAVLGTLLVRLPLAGLKF